MRWRGGTHPPSSSCSTPRRHARADSRSAAPDPSLTAPPVLPTGDGAGNAEGRPPTAGTATSLESPGRLMDLDALQLRREARRRQRRRRRLMAICVLAALAAFAAIVAIVLVHGSSGRAPAARATASAGAPRTGAHSHHAKARAPATDVRIGPPGTDAIPILMYHVIAAPPPGAPFPGLYVEPSELAVLMRALEHAGLHAATRA